MEKCVNNRLPNCLPNWCMQNLLIILILSYSLETTMYFWHHVHVFQVCKMYYAYVKSKLKVFPLDRLPGHVQIYICLPRIPLAILGRIIRAVALAPPPPWAAVLSEQYPSGSILFCPIWQLEEHCVCGKWSVEMLSSVSKCVQYNDSKPWGRDCYRSHVIENQATSFRVQSCGI